MREALTAWLSDQVGQPVVVRDLAPVSSVGNARDPWSFTATWPGHEERCVLMVQAVAGQLESELGPEFHTVDRLAGTGVPVPGALWLDEAGTALGRPCFVTRWVPGTADIRGLRNPDGDPALAAVARQLAAAAARLHAVDPAPFDHLATVGTADAARAQLDEWDDRFTRQRLEPHPELVYLLAWLRRRLPVARRISVVHGDLRFGNLLYEGDQLTGLLDWEMTHRGDPVEDLGWVYRSVWTAERVLPFDDFLAAYGAAGGHVPDPDHLRWYQVFSEVKHSVISLTGARSFATGATANLRHADRSATVPAFMTRALELVEGSC